MTSTLISRNHLAQLVVAVLFAGTTLSASAAQPAPPAAKSADAVGASGYNVPPKNILDVLHAPSPPSPYVSPTNDRVLLVSWQSYPPMSRVATPFLRLAGVRIELLRELCEETGIAFNLRPVSEADVRAADEVLLSSASKEVIAVTRLDGEQVGHGALRGRPGPVYARLHEAYQRAIQSQSI